MAFHGAIGHVLWRPEFELVAVRILPVDGRALFAVSRSPDGIRVRHLAVVEVAELQVDVFRPDEKPIPGQDRPRTGARRELYGLEESTVEAVGQLLEHVPGARTAIPGRLAAEDSFVKAGPALGIVGSDRVVIDPEHRAGPLIFDHRSSLQSAGFWLLSPPEYRRSGVI